MFTDRETVVSKAKPEGKNKVFKVKKMLEYMANQKESQEGINTGPLSEGTSGQNTPLGETNQESFSTQVNLISRPEVQRNIENTLNCKKLHLGVIQTESSLWKED